ncbi:translation factor [Calocera cornea HHB12733]|uniref:Threonylcarbamoyl-AMP synthase n=1 Tax=Calocera cornea HHB12733 TaxID=1353952 RepID=A0A165IN11_9BASI|nr:translation factor [Calocera cornea HHB12733]
MASVNGTTLENGTTRMETKVLPCDDLGMTFPDITSSAPPVVPSASTLSALQEATRDLLDRQLPIALPTETVYGLAANALHAPSVARIFSTKGRPADNPLIVHVSSLPMLRSLLPAAFVMPPEYEKLIAAFWPGPLTMLFPKSDVIPPICTAGQPTVAVRMPSHPIARALIALSNTPLAAPSANSSGKPSPTKAIHVLHDLRGKIPLILDGGACEVGVESTVVDGLSQEGVVKVLRPGGVTVEELQRVLGEGTKVLVHKRDYEDSEIESAPTTPGMKYRHYSPTVPVVLLLTSPPPAGRKLESVHDILDELHASISPQDEFKVGLLSLSDSDITKACIATHYEVQRFSLGKRSSPAEAAQRLFDGLLTLDGEGVEVILVEGVEEVKEGLAVMNRVRKAAGEVRYVSV